MFQPIFHPDSYGYISGRLALDAVGVVRERCWRYNWVIDLDIQGFFDNIDHGLMLYGERIHGDRKWVLLQHQRGGQSTNPNGGRQSLRKRKRHTTRGRTSPQRLANILSHHAFDEWMQLNYRAFRLPDMRGLLLSTVVQKLRRSVCWSHRVCCGSRDYILKRRRLSDCKGCKPPRKL